MRPLTAHPPPKPQPCCKFVNCRLRVYVATATGTGNEHELTVLAGYDASTQSLWGDTPGRGKAFADSEVGGSDYQLGPKRFLRHIVRVYSGNGNTQFGSNLR